MTLELYYHPLASYCWKALIALYEAELPFERHLVDLGDPRQRARFLELTPLGKFPLLRVADSGRCVVESSIVIEYLALVAPSAARLFPGSAENVLEVRARDRFFDLYVMEPMGKIIEDTLRAAHERDPRGVADAHARLDTAYGVAERFLRASGWAVGDDFTLADCSAAPALF
jgi:glutathione S-transferase